MPVLTMSCSTPGTRQTAIWYLNSGNFTGGVLGPAAPAGRILNRPEDFNGDGRPDYVLSNPSTRQIAIWFLNGAALTGSAFGPTLPVNYRISSLKLTRNWLITLETWARGSKFFVIAW